MKKIILVFFALIVTLCVFTGCKSSDSAPSSTTTPQKDESENFYISPELLSSYTIIYAEGCGSKIINSAKSLKAAVKDTYGIELKVGDDFYREGYNTIGEYEIIVGESNRAESKEFLMNLKCNDYGYSTVGKKLVIAGHTPENTVTAVDHFISEILKAKSDKVFFSNDNKYIYNDNYAVDSIKLNGVELGKYTIVYNYLNKNYNQALAERLKNEIMKISGYSLRIETDKDAYSGGYEIIIGDSSHLTDVLKKRVASLSEDKYLVTSNENLTWITSSSVSGILGGISAFVDRLTPVNGNRNAELTVNDGFSHEYDKNTLSTMSFNVYIGNLTSTRIELVTTMIKNYMPDTFGVQEANITWMNAISEALPEYAYVGEGRDGRGTNGEYSAVFYRKDKFDLIDGGTKWLSDTPDVKGSKYAESNCVRIMSYAVLEEKSSRVRFIHVNTHLDHISSEAREKQTSVLLKEISKLPDHPVILTGDFNCEVGSAPINDINTNFVNSANKATVMSNDPTFHGYEGKTKIIDFIFFSKNRFAVELYKVCNEMINGSYASDHHPVYTEYVLIS